MNCKSHLCLITSVYVDGDLFPYNNHIDFHQCFMDDG